MSRRRQNRRLGKYSSICKAAGSRAGMTGSIKRQDGISKPVEWKPTPIGKLLRQS